MPIDTISNTSRLSLLRVSLEAGKFVRAIESHSPLAAIIAEHLRSGENDERKFDAFWSSSLTDSALRGLPDTEILDTGARLAWINSMFAVTRKPLIMDGDTGGRLDQFVRTVRSLEREGVSAIVIEDKTGVKRNSLISDGSLHELADVDQFAEKIRQGKKAQQGGDFMVFARLEGIIAGLSMGEMFERASAFVEAGADGLVIHSKDPDESIVMDFAHRVATAYPTLHLVAIPTAYPSVYERELADAGINVVIYANQLLRAAARAMGHAGQLILDHGRALEADRHCIDTKKLIDIDDDSWPIVGVPRSRKGIAL